ncbi:unnamed protein product [Spirodela intermedia]|uniref:glutathione-specific gamma-glutamylcyclotransferase n=1 Tax=Spirodela intermedia TaxID=51605 RepID=A0A7I8KVM4_SPIIN|nr:unnamed protein product [Spirodela intermedia]
MVMWVFGYGSLIWKAGFRYEERLVGFIHGYRRVFYQGRREEFTLLGMCFSFLLISLLLCLNGGDAGSTDHRGTPSFPGRTVTLEATAGEVCWGVAYRISEEDEKTALESLEVREKQYDMKVYLDFFTDPGSGSPSVSGVMVYVASADKYLNKNYLGPASIEEMAMQIVRARGPSGPNREYLFHLEDALAEFGCEDTHVSDLAGAVRRIIMETEAGFCLEEASNGLVK